MTKACISFRVGVSLWMPERRFHELLALFERHKGVTDEVTFFTSETHPCLPLDVIRERATILAGRMPAMRQLGYRTGINILSTLGHHDENLAHSLSGDFTPMTDLEGEVCRGALCPNDERMQRYIRELYATIAATGPDYIWIDDDVRLAGHMPITAGCFCDHCLELFAGETGATCDRQGLKAAFNAGARDQKLSWRKRWIEHNRQTLARLFGLIEKTVHGLNPGLPLGFMTGNRFYEGYDFDRWAAILAGPDHAEVMWRPGGGFYSDESLAGLVDKSHDIGRQVAVLPPSVQSIQSEIENFPYQRLKKAEHTTALEAAAYMASGCTGTAFNVLSMYDEPLEEYEPLVATLHRSRPFLDLLAGAFGRAAPVGVYTGWNKDTFITAGVDGPAWIKSGDWTAMGNYARELFEIGLPAAYSPENSRVTALTANSPLALTDAEARKILAGGVYCDAKALTLLNEMGYGELTGFHVERSLEMDCIEQFAEHPLNGKWAGRKRDGRQSFRGWAWPCAALVPTDKRAGTLARIIDYAGQEVAPCCSGVFENALGGRICVAGYFPWTFLQSLSKSAQIKATFRWLAGESLPAYVASFHKTNFWVRQPGNDRMALALINPSLDDARNVVLMIRTPADEVSLFDMNCARTTIRTDGTDGPYRRFTIPVIPAWRMILAAT